MYLLGADWHVRGEIGDTGFDQVFTPVGPTDVAPLGGYDIDPDGDPEVWLKVGVGAYATIPVSNPMTSMFRSFGCCPLTL